MWRFVRKKPTANGSNQPTTSASSSEDLLQHSVNEEVNKAREICKRNRKRKSNTHCSAELRCKIGRYAAENGNDAAVKKFQVPESTVRGFKTKYLALLKKEGPLSNPSDITKIDHGNLGRPLKLGSSLDKEVGGW